MYEKVGDLQVELVAEIETEVHADFLPPVSVSFKVEELRPGQTRFLHPGEEWIYLRRE